MDLPLTIWTSNGVQVQISEDRSLELAGNRRAVADVIRCLGDHVDEAPPDDLPPMAIWGGKDPPPTQDHPLFR